MQRYSEFFFPNVSLLAILWVFERNNFPFLKKIFQIFCPSYITLFFLEITSIFVLCQKKERNLLLKMFHLFTDRQKFLLEREEQHLTAFLQILWCQSSVVSLAWICLVQEDISDSDLKKFSHRRRFSADLHLSVENAKFLLGRISRWIREEIRSICCMA